MTRYGQLVLLVLIAVVMSVVLHLMARRRLTMGFGLFWLMGLLGLAALVSSRSLLVAIAGVLGTLYPDAAIRLLAFVALLGVQIYLSVRLSLQENRLAELGQQVALLEYELRRDGPREPGATPPTAP